MEQVHNFKVYFAPSRKQSRSRSLFCRFVLPPNEFDLKNCSLLKVLYGRYFSSISSARTAAHATAAARHAIVRVPESASLVLAFVLAHFIGFFHSPARKRARRNHTLREINKILWWSTRRDDVDSSFVESRTTRRSTDSKPTIALVDGCINSFSSCSPRNVLNDRAADNERCSRCGTRGPMTSACHASAGTCSAINISLGVIYEYRPEGNALSTEHEKAIVFGRWTRSPS